jgi:glycosyltransferase involved in cell wall biosynthesis
MTDLHVHAVVPIYNNQATLRATIDSLLAEPLVERIHAIDDGSTDGCCEELAGLSERLNIVRQDNAGPSAARNHGIDLALREERVSQVLLLDADDTLEPEALGPALARLGEHGEAVAAVNGRYEVTRDAGGEPQGEPVRREPPAEWADRLLPSRGLVFSPIRFFGASGVLLTRQALRSGVRFDSSLAIGEDRDFLYRLAEAGPILVLAAPLLRVTIHAGGDNLTGPAHLERWLRDHRTLVERYGDDPDAAEPLRQTSRWLLGHACRVLAKQGSSLTPELWRQYRQLFRQRGWRLPGKAWKWRYLQGPFLRLVGLNRGS